MPNKAIAPSSSLLLVMIASAERKFDAAREQALLRAEAQEEARMERFMVAEAKARALRARWGYADR